jgi:hypothetical protein
MSFKLPNGKKAACRISSFTFSAKPPTYREVLGLEPFPPVATSVVDIENAWKTPSSGRLPIISCAR